MQEPGSGPIPLRVPGVHSPLAIFVHDERDRHVSRQLRESGIWEPYESRLLLDSLQPGAVFLDVGANLGYFSLLAADRVGPAGKVVAIEPDPANFLLLQRSIVHPSRSRHRPGVRSCRRRAVCRDACLQRYNGLSGSPRHIDKASPILEAVSYTHLRAHET